MTVTFNSTVSGRQDIPTDCTWANRPTNPKAGDRIRLTDHRNNICVYNGSLWIPQGAWAAGGAAIALTGSTSLTTLLSTVIPGGMLGTNGQIRVQFKFSYTNSANNKTINVNLGAANIFGRTRTAAQTDSLMLVLANRNSASSQLELTNNQIGGAPWMANNATAVSTYSVNTAIDQNLTFTAQLGLSSETINLEAYTIEILPA